VPATSGEENSTLDLDQGAALQVCEICPPPAGSVEAYFPLQGRASGNAPEEQKS
jgi:hypothetical protein